MDSGKALNFLEISPLISLQPGRVSLTAGIGWPGLTCYHGNIETPSGITSSLIPPQFYTNLFLPLIRRSIIISASSIVSLTADDAIKGEVNDDIVRSSHSICFRGLLSLGEHQMLGCDWCAVLVEIPTFPRLNSSNWVPQKKAFQLKWLPGIPAMEPVGVRRKICLWRKDGRKMV